MLMRTTAIAAALALAACADSGPDTESAATDPADSGYAGNQDTMGAPVEGGVGGAATAEDPASAPPPTAPSDATGAGGPGGSSAMTAPGAARTTPGVGSEDSASGSTGGSGAPSPDATQDASSTPTFVQRAAASSTLEIQTGEIAQSKSKNAQVRGLAQTLVKDHKTASSELNRLAAGARVTPAAVDPATQAKIDEIRAADEQGFDDRYLDLVIDAHEESIANFERYAKDGSNQELRAFAVKQIPILRAHLQEAQQVRQGMNAG